MSAMAVDVDALERQFRERGYSFGIFTDPPGQEWRGFVHDVDEIVVPLEGSVEITVAGTVHRPGVGEEVFIPAAAVHDVVTSAESGSRWAYGYRRGRDGRGADRVAPD